MTRDVPAEIRSTIDKHDVVLFMKGCKDAPHCGFSGLAVQILNHLEVDFMDVNVLEDPEIRQGIKEFSDWPTIPQLYIKGDFIGGSDIMKELFLSGELQSLLQEKKIARKA